MAETKTDETEIKTDAKAMEKPTTAKVRGKAPKTDAPAPGMVRCRVTKKGAGRVHTGKGIGADTGQNDRIDVEPAVARELEDNDLVEILEGDA